ncbi:hypothetical protein NM688_g7322 [Phlebia brevispora]|uniref:Uncharacterized protein n=1 Tax=Phlebia brevispora TaxID=194682 RepID=A0ACC1S6R1_9APHY|nr:hypothetical protein NM688_g7322 [Phlebia brevispora]
MPHKRAKRSIRQQKQSQQGDNLAPSTVALSREAIPKGAARILNAAKVQQEWREKKRKLSEDAQDGEGTSNKRRRKAGDGPVMKIQPGETIARFNRRVEDSMRPLVRDAVKTSAAAVRRTKKEEESVKADTKATKKKRSAADRDSARPAAQATSKRPNPESDSTDGDSSPALRSGVRGSAKEFAEVSTSAPRRLNDIVQAPPELKKLPRGAKPRQQAPAGARASTNLKDGVLSMAQKVRLEEERERAINAYRELKKRKATG